MADVDCPNKALCCFDGCANSCIPSALIASYVAAGPTLNVRPGLEHSEYGYSGYIGPLADAAPASGLVYHPNGAVTPVDTPSVSAARSEHLAAKEAALAAAGPALATVGAIGYSSGLGGYDTDFGYVDGYTAGFTYATPTYAAAPVLAGGFGLAGYKGYGAELGYTAGYGYGLGLVAHPNGAVVPAEDLNIVAARESALAALYAGGDGRAPNAPNFVAGADGLVAVGPTLVPADTAEVAAAKAAFFAAFNRALAGH